MRANYTIRHWRVNGFVIVLLALLAPVAPVSAASFVADVRGGLDGACDGTTFSAPSGGFSESDVGKSLVVSGDSRSAKAANAAAWWANAPLFTTVSAVINATTVQLAEACGPAMQGVLTAQWHVGTDNTTALQECVDTGNCSVPPGNYLFVASDVRMSHNSRLICQPGAEFLFPRHDDYGGATRALLRLVDVSNVTISGCTIVGTNINGTFTQSMETNAVIAITSSRSVNNTVTRNTIRNSWSDGDIIITGQGPGSDGGPPARNTVSRNTLSGCGLNGITIISGIDNVIEDNVLTDCSLDIEPNHPVRDRVDRNVIQNNFVRNVTRWGRTEPHQSRFGSIYGEHWTMMFSTCAVPICGGLGAASVVVRNNIISNDVELWPHCARGRIRQGWDDNRTIRDGGASCDPNTGGCAWTPVMCRPKDGLGRWVRRLKSIIPGKFLRYDGVTEPW